MTVGRSGSHHAAHTTAHTASHHGPGGHHDHHHHGVHEHEGRFHKGEGAHALSTTGNTPGHAHALSTSTGRFDGGMRQGDRFVHNGGFNGGNPVSNSRPVSLAPPAMPSSPNINDNANFDINDLLAGLFPGGQTDTGTPTTPPMATPPSRIVPAAPHVPTVPRTPSAPSVPSTPQTPSTPTNQIPRDPPEPSSPQTPPSTTPLPHIPPPTGSRDPVVNASPGLRRLTPVPGLPR